MKGKRPLLVLAGLLLLAVPLGLACGEEEAPSPTPALPLRTATEARPAPGAAGIPSNPRPVRGLEGILELDDGLAIFKERPADEDRTGVTDDVIRLGRIADLSGPLAAYEPFWGETLRVLIDRINEAGGIHGRRIELITYDHKSNPAVAVEVTKRLVEQDRVFALFFNIGSPAHAAVHDYHVQKKVPYIFYFDGSTTGMEPETSSYDINGQNPDILGGVAMVDALFDIDPNAHPMLVYANFPASQAGREGILYAMNRLGKELVGEISHDFTQVDLTAIAQQVANSGADWVIYHGSIVQAISLVKTLRELGSDMRVFQWGWVPTGDPGTDQLFDGTYQVSFFCSEFACPEREVYQKLRAVAEEEGIPYNPFLSAQALMVVEYLVRALELAGPDLTREGLIEAIELGFDGSFQCSVCVAPAIMGPQDHWANEDFIVLRWDAEAQRFETLGQVDYETSRGRGIRGNVPGYPCRPETCPWQE